MIVLGTHRYRCEDTKMNLRGTGCQDVNMTDLNDGCVHWHHFTSTAVNLVSRYLSTAPNSVTFKFTYVIYINHVPFKQCWTFSLHISCHLFPLGPKFLWSSAFHISSTNFYNGTRTEYFTITLRIHCLYVLVYFNTFCLLLFVAQRS